MVRMTLADKFDLDVHFSL